MAFSLEDALSMLRTFSTLMAFLSSLAMQEPRIRFVVSRERNASSHPLQTVAGICSTRDRLFLIILYRLWPGWRNVLVNARPETVIRWHKAGFRQFWHWKSRPNKPGRPRISPEIQHLIRLMAQANPGWGAPRIHGELLLLGFEIHERTVSRYLARIRETPARPSQTWMTFLRNHAKVLVSIDFFVVYTVTFRPIARRRDQIALTARG